MELDVEHLVVKPLEHLELKHLELERLDLERLDLEHLLDVELGLDLG